MNACNPNDTNGAEGEADTASASAVAEQKADATLQSAAPPAGREPEGQAKQRLVGHADEDIGELIGLDPRIQCVRNWAYC